MYPLARIATILVLCCLGACQSHNEGGGATPGGGAAPAPAAATPSPSPRVTQSVFLGAFAGDGATFHPDNVKPRQIAFYGTDLGFTYRHGTQLQILFGDSWATEKYAPIQASTQGRYDDSFGSIDLREWPDAARIDASHIPPIRLGQNPGSTETAAIDPGYAMDLGKTPMGGFSNGTREFGIFNLTKPQACATDAECSDGLTCDKTLGYFGARASEEANLTLGCRDGTPGCNADTAVDSAGKAVANSGFCTDETSVMRGERVSNLLSAMGLRVRIGLRDTNVAKKYLEPHDWLTNKFMNVTARSVESFDPARAADEARQNYAPAEGSGGNRRVFLWGRPGFIGVAANKRSLGLYFAYVDLPAGPGYTWRPMYYAGMADGAPKFSAQQTDAVPADLDSTVEGVQADEVIDVVNQMSVAWVAPLRKWVMFYGGGMSTLPTKGLPTCGVLQLFTGAECTNVVVGNGAVRMRTADHAWGPWTPPQDVIVGGVAANGAKDQYAPGGALRHPACKDPTCAPHSDMFAYQTEEYGFFYAANIIEQWVAPAGDGVDVVWNASTWDPYRVVLLKTHIAHPSAGNTTVLGPFTGHYAPLHPDNISPNQARYYGTDLGWSYEHQGKLQFLFGDTSATEGDEPIQASTGGKFDDSFGSIDLAEWKDPSRITADNIPRIKLGQNRGTTEVSAIDVDGHAMEGFKTPIGGFSNGQREFGVFYSSKPQACRSDADCGADFSCDTGLGFVGEPWDTDKGITFACIDGSPACASDPLGKGADGSAAASGFCIDRTSSFYGTSAAGRLAAVAVKNLIGIRDTGDPRRYTDLRTWLTNKFSNGAFRTVNAFDPALERNAQDYRAAVASGGKARVFIWGRPGFIGVRAVGRPLGLYFAYADLPAGPGFAWTVNYYAGVDANGKPRFTRNERDAVAVDLDASREGVQPEEAHDIVDQMSLSWVAPLGKWIMFYGGGIPSLPLELLPNCGVLELFTRADCGKVDLGNGALRMRSADNPWGPWSAPSDLLVGGDPKHLPLEGQYVPGGVLRHPGCTDPKCVTHTHSNDVSKDEYGVLYGASIIESWTRPAGNGVDILWNASTWDPYRIVLLRTHLDHSQVESP